MLDVHIKFTIKIIINTVSRWVMRVLTDEEEMKMLKPLQDYVVLKKGQKVIFKEYSGTHYTLDDEDYMILKEEDILAIIEEE